MKVTAECKKTYIPPRKNAGEKCQKMQTSPTMEKSHKTPQNTQKHREIKAKPLGYPTSRRYVPNTAHITGILAKTGKPRGPQIQENP